MQRVNACKPLKINIVLARFNTTRIDEVDQCGAAFIGHGLRFYPFAHLLWQVSRWDVLVAVAGNRNKGKIKGNKVVT